MRVVDPGHMFELATLDGSGEVEGLRFVKRMGARYPGNTLAYPGTTIQEVMRALIYRLTYVHDQIADRRNPLIIEKLRDAIWLLEERAAERHDRLNDFRDTLIRVDIENEPTCATCGHMLCAGHAPSPVSAGRPKGA